MFTNIRLIGYISLALVVLLGGGYIYYLRSVNSSMSRQVTDLTVNVQHLENSLKQCTDNYNELLSKTSVQTEQYKQRVDELVKKISILRRPSVEIPKEVRKDINVEMDDCRKMIMMIDYFVGVQNEMSSRTK